METNDTHLELSQPYAKYLVNVTTKPVDTGYWSDVAMYTYTTPAIGNILPPLEELHSLNMIYMQTRF